MGWNRRSRYASPRTQWDDALSRMDPLGFERLIGDYFEREGYRVERVGTGGSRRRYDGGIDLKLYRGAETIVVQCKRHTHSLVTHNPMHELIGVMHTAKATGAILVNSGEFSDYARKMAAEEPRLRLIDGAELRTLLGDLLPVEIAPAPTTPATTEPLLSAPTTGRTQGSVAFKTKPKRSTAGASLIKIGVLFGFLLGLKLCASIRPNAPRLAPEPAANAPQKVEQPLQAPTIDVKPKTSPSLEFPAQPAEQRRPYQTPDEAIKVLEERTPEV